MSVTRTGARVSYKERGQKTPESVHHAHNGMPNSKRAHIVSYHIVCVSVCVQNQQGQAGRVGSHHSSVKGGTRTPRDVMRITSMYAHNSKAHTESENKPKIKSKSHHHSLLFSLNPPHGFETPEPHSSPQKHEKEVRKTSQVPRR